MFLLKLIDTSQGGPAMSIIEWHEGFAVGIADLDDDHRLIFKHIQRVHDVLTGQSRPSTVRLASAELIENVAKHFAAEEALMARLHDKASKAHCADHLARHADFLALARDVARKAEDRRSALRALERLALSLTEYELVRYDFELVGCLLREGVNILDTPCWTPAYPGYP